MVLDLMLIRIKPSKRYKKKCLLLTVPGSGMDVTLTTPIPFPELLPHCSFSLPVIFALIFYKNSSPDTSVNAKGRPIKKISPKYIE
jgi:hypothetical protein